VVYTRQGNPGWASQERDGFSPVRSNDQFFGNAPFDPKPDWVDLNKVAIPQADEQQHLLTNIILRGNADRKPLPRFWFLPNGFKAAVVMTGDDHASGGTAGRFDQYKALSPDNSQTAVNNWQAIRGSSYMFPATPLTNLQVKGYQDDNFDMSIHVHTDCANWTQTTLNNYYLTQLGQWSASFPSLFKPSTHRIHCLVWSNWVSLPKVEFDNGVRLDVNYYYWPGTWVQNRPGMFTGSGMPMRFADLDGSLIDTYQVTTQMTDESDQVFPETIDALLDNATGTPGYYGVFCANMHTDQVASVGSDAIINSALNHNVPVISAKQMLTWLDARNSSTISNIVWNSANLSFTIGASPNAFNLRTMLPVEVKANRLTTITVNGSPVSYTKETIKGIEYAIFPGVSGNYVANYSAAICTVPQATIEAVPADCSGSTINLRLTTASGVSPFKLTINGQTYSNAVAGTTITSFAAEESVWGNSGTPDFPNLNDGSPIEVGAKIRASVDGVITGVRFYKGVSNTGTHTGNLYNSAGTKLATAIFESETASGWQQVKFLIPVSILANQTYVVSYLSASGGYAHTPGYFTSTGVTNRDLTALKSGVDGGNGVYMYGGGFPTNSFNGSNYWVDVLFKPNTYSFQLTNITDANTCVNSGNISTATITQSTLQGPSQTFYRDADGDGYGNAAVTVAGCAQPAGYVSQAGDCNDADAAIKPGAVEICDGKDNNCNGSVDEGCTFYYRDYDNDTYGNALVKITATTPPTGYVSNNTDCNDSSASIRPGATEVCGNGIDDNCNGSIDEGCQAVIEQTIFGNTASPQTPNDYDGKNVEVGVKFRSSLAGTITGIRFYKAPGNTGTHTGNLWTITGTKLATIIFTNETASGWQVMRFATPVPITANTIYVASVFAASGKYPSTTGAFTNAGITNGPLTALQAGVSGPNGVYRYGTGFPTLSYQNSNYFVDVLFKASAGAPATTAQNAETRLQLEATQSRSEPLSFRVHPNATRSYFTAQTRTSDRSMISIKVLDVAGRVVENRSNISPNTVFTFGQNYTAGVYFAEVRQARQKVTLKLIKSTQ
jgi:hypothetical protein